VAWNEAGETPGSPETLLARVETERVVVTRLLELDEPFKTTLLLRYYEGRSAAQIARDQDVPPGTVRWRLAEGLRRLREQLDGEFGGDRERWSRALIPAAFPHGAPSARPRLAVRFVPIGATLTVMLGGGAWLLRPGGADTRAVAPAAPETRFAVGARSRRQPETETAAMTRERARKAALFRNVALPALIASAASEEGQETPPVDNEHAEQLLMTFCLESNAVMYECKERFADAIVEAIAVGRKTSPEDRARYRQSFLRDIDELGAGPLAQRRARCKSKLDSLAQGGKAPPWPNAGVQGIADLISLIRSCKPERPCAERLACMKPAFARDRVHEE
jgi:hypothetical protein